MALHRGRARRDRAALHGRRVQHRPELLARRSGRTSRPGRRTARPSTAPRRPTVGRSCTAPPTTDPVEQPTAEYPLLLTTGRTLYHFHTRTRTSCSSCPMPARCRSTTLGPRIENDPAFPERINVNVGNLRPRPVEIADVRTRRGRNPRLRDRRLRERGRGNRQQARDSPRCRVDMTGGSLTDQLGAGRADPHARHGDPRVFGRARPRGAAMSVETITLGCRLQLRRERDHRALGTGRTRIGSIVNSCAVTNEAVRQTRQAIRRAHRQRPGANILVTGCAAELEPAAFAAMPGVARVVGNAAQAQQPSPANDVMRASARRLHGTRPQASSRCRPAAITAAPSARSGRRAGPAVRCRSRRSATPLRARSTAARSEIVLTGVDITDYRGRPRAALPAPARRRAAAAVAAPLPVREHRD